MEKFMRAFKKLIAGAVAVAALLMLTLGTEPGTAVVAGSSAIPGQYIVVLKDGASPANVANAHGVTADFTYSTALNGFAFRGSARAAAALAKNPHVDYVIADQAVALVEPMAVSAGPSIAAAQVAPTGLRRIGGSTNGTTQTLANDGAGVGVAVIDTGIDLRHPDLATGITGKSCIFGRSANDDNGHGSHVAGTIAALDNGVGSVGVAPAAKLYAVKVLNSQGSGSWSSVICGIDWVAANASVIKVANLSLGGGGTATPSNANCTNGNNDALHTAICRAAKNGVTFVVAAGNSAADSTTFVPAAYEEVITVSALSDSNGAPGGGGAAPACRTGERDDWFATFSNFGAPVDIGAPGVCIYSLWKSGGYATISGTSMASPHVAGAAALYKSADPSATPAGIKAGLLAGQEAGPISGDPDTAKEGIVHIK
jgi:subtilisin